MNELEKGLSSDEIIALAQKADALSEAEQAVFIKRFPDELIYEEIGRRMANYKDFANRYAKIGKEFELGGAL